uniref:Uncharacterized protein n=1 Tax=Rhizophora mucronata TaxID=61149 RepID=A0A2P2QDZ2_RHIMU
MEVNGKKSMHIIVKDKYWANCYKIRYNQTSIVLCSINKGLNP